MEQVKEIAEGLGIQEPELTVTTTPVRINAWVSCSGPSLVFMCGLWKPEIYACSQIGDWPIFFTSNLKVKFNISFIKHKISKICRIRIQNFPLKLFKKTKETNYILFISREHWDLSIILRVVVFKREHIKKVIK